MNCLLDFDNTQANTPRMKVRALPSAFMLGLMCIGAVTAGLQHPAAPPQLPVPPVHLTRSEIEIYKWAQTLTDWTPRQVQDCPFLHKLRPAVNQHQLPMVLERVGQTATILFRDFPRISCDEEVISERYRGRRYVSKHHFRYIVIPRPVGDVLSFEEYRTDLEGNPLDASSLSDLIMITANYVSTWLYLSPADQHDSHFRYFGIQPILNRECHVVGFAQDPERVQSVGELRIGEKSAALLVQGLAWFDSQSFQVLRITTWLLAPRDDIDLSSTNSTVDFHPVQPSGSDRVLWLPRDVTVGVFYRGIQIRNTHHYSNFKLFRVESTIKPGR
jgi:hypothetical protein